MPPPNGTQGTHACSSQSKHIATRLANSHEQRISELAQRLQASLLDPYERDPARASTSSTSPLLTAHVRSPPGYQQAGGNSLPAAQHEGVKLSEVFDELIACDQANRLQQLMQEATFKDREILRLKEALERALKDSSWVQKKQAAAEEALSTASSTSTALHTELRTLHASFEQQREQLNSITSAKLTAEHAATTAESKAATLEAQLSSKSAELEKTQRQYKRLLDDQQAELERLRQQVQQQSGELSKLQASSAQKEQGLLQQLQSFNGSLQDIRASHAADKATSEQLQKQLDQQHRELQDARASKQQAEASAKQLESLLADSEAERRTLRAKYINLGGPGCVLGIVHAALYMCLAVGKLWTGQAEDCYVHAAAHVRAVRGRLWATYQACRSNPVEC